MWAIEWHSKNRLDGTTRHLRGGGPYSPGGKGVTLLFPTRQMARDHINEKWGYIRYRKDLRKEPHGWRIPQPVRVKVIKENECAHN